jgi:hypothetical protein
VERAVAGNAGPPGRDAAEGAGPARLDEVMLAMDVVDTLRHRQLLVEQELGGEERERVLLDRLRQLYAAQGIDVPDRVLQEGVAALREDRFAYRPPPPGLATSLARLYVRRARIGAALAVVLLVLGIVWGVQQATVVAPRQALARDLETVHARVLEVAAADEARSQADALLETGRSALAAEEVSAARAALADLESLESRLEQRFALLIATGPGSVSGVWRVPDANPAARNYYLIVEALDEQGLPVRVEVRNEETGRLERVSEFGLRVSQEEFERVAADKRADGIIQERLVGEKVRGELEPRYSIPTTGGAITRW